MRKLNLSFEFHNVGQGLFYSGRIGAFDFVYDCGSKCKTGHLMRVIKNYTSRTSELDLLILSHLHEDHVSGLDTLTKRTKVDTVIFPYLSPIERLTVALVRLDLPLWYYDFLSDPVSYLIEVKNVNNVILIGGTERDSSEDFVNAEGSFENSEKKLDLSRMPEDLNLIEEINKEDPKWGGFLKKKSLVTKNHKGYMLAAGIWLFKFYNCRVKDSKLNIFEKYVRNILGTPIDLHKVIRDKSKLTNLKSCYEKLHGDFNDTSLVVYHEPTSQVCTSLRVGFHCKLPYPSTYQCSSPRKYCLYTPKPSSVFGQLLTGDINLKKNRKEIEKHFRNFLSKAFLIQVPHHGSKYNWDAMILSKFMKNTIWVASAGVSKPQGHPDPSVIQSLRKNNHFLWSHEFTKVIAKS